MILISYRRDDSAGTAGRLQDRLEGEFGRDQVFMDVATSSPSSRPRRVSLLEIHRNVPALSSRKRPPRLVALPRPRPACVGNLHAVGAVANGMAKDIGEQ